MMIKILGEDKAEAVVVRVGAAARAEQVSKAILRRIDSINSAMRRVTQ